MFFVKLNLIIRQVFNEIIGSHAYFHDVGPYSQKYKAKEGKKVTD